jgi:phytoene dehydrogenase-like protein
VWRRAPLVVAHPSGEGPTAVLSTDIDTTAESLDRFAAGDGDGRRELFALWQPIEQPLMDAFSWHLPHKRTRF